jgi:cob(I)alamin adenosyltransferase
MPMVKIYTGAGDSGLTRLMGRESVPKDDLRIEVIGVLDELNSHLGFIGAAAPDPDIMKILAGIQADIFLLSAGIASENSRRPGTTIDMLKIKYMEEVIDIFEKDLPPLKNFILPGGTERAARLHVARTVCRRAERRFVSIMNRFKVNRMIVVYLNRLSDLLFVLARVENHRNGVEDSIWSPTNE